MAEIQKVQNRYGVARQVTLEIIITANFYRDLGWDADIDYIGDYLISEDIRHDLGLKYYKITGQTSLEDKALYNPYIAIEQAKKHAEHFINSRIAQGDKIRQELKSPIHILSPYDAELFGHWWYEGPEFIGSILRKAENTRLNLITPSQYIDLDKELQKVDAAVSSWGNNGYFETWLNGTNDWMYPLLRDAENKMQQLCINLEQKPQQFTLEKAKSTPTGR